MPKAKRARKPALRVAAKKPNAKSRRASASKKVVNVDSYVRLQLPGVQAILNRMRALVAAAAPEAIETLKWGQPVYEVNGPIAYLKATKTSVNFGFWRGAMLDAPSNLLEGDGARMRHVKLLEITDIREPVLAPLIRQAALLNARLGNPTLGRR